MQQNMSTNLDAPNEDVLIEAREDSTAGGVALVDNLQVPPFVDDNEGGGDAINEDNQYLIRLKQCHTCQAFCLDQCCIHWNRIVSHRKR